MEKPAGDPALTGTPAECAEDDDGLVDISQSVRRLQQRIAVMQRSLQPKNDVMDRYRTRPRGHDTADYVFKVTTGARNLVKTEERSAFKMRKLYEDMEETEQQLHKLSNELHRRRSRDKYRAQDTAADFVYRHADEYSLQDFI